MKEVLDFLNKGISSIADTAGRANGNAKALKFSLISVAQDLPFLRRFGEMAVIRLSVAAISLGIGLPAKSLLGIDV